MYHEIQHFINIWYKVVLVDGNKHFQEETEILASVKRYAQSPSPNWGE